MSRIITCILFVIISLSIKAQLKQYTFEQLDTLSVKKPIVIFLHTNWCTFCEAMEQTTFKDKNITNQLNTYFYFSSFNAEYKESIKFKNRIYNFKPTGRKTGVHELAEVLGTYENKLQYPTTVILNTDYEIVFQYPYVLRTKEFIELLKATLSNEKI